MKRIAFALAALLISSTAHAENVVIGCPLLSKYSESDVQTLINYARSAVSERELVKIYSQYLSLRNACHTNTGASRTVAVSDTLRNWLAQNGISLREFSRTASM
jgi:hypothetical protein